MQQQYQEYCIDQFSEHELVVRAVTSVYNTTHGTALPEAEVMQRMWYMLKHDERQIDCLFNGHKNERPIDQMLGVSKRYSNKLSPSLKAFKERILPKIMLQPLSIKQRRTFQDFIHNLLPDMLALTRQLKIKPTVAWFVDHVTTKVDQKFDYRNQDFNFVQVDDIIRNYPGRRFKQQGVIDLEGLMSKSQNDRQFFEEQQAKCIVSLIVFDDERFKDYKTSCILQSQDERKQPPSCTILSYLARVAAPRLVLA